MGSVKNAKGSIKGAFFSSGLIGPPSSAFGKRNQPRKENHKWYSHYTL